MPSRCERLLKLGQQAFQAEVQNATLKVKPHTSNSDRTTPESVAGTRPHPPQPQLGFKAKVSQWLKNGQSIKDSTDPHTRKRRNKEDVKRSLFLDGVSRPSKENFQFHSLKRSHLQLGSQNGSPKAKKKSPQTKGSDANLLSNPNNVTSTTGSQEAKNSSPETTECVKNALLCVKSTIGLQEDKDCSPEIIESDSIASSAANYNVPSEKDLQETKERSLYTTECDANVSSFALRNIICETGLPEAKESSPDTTECDANVPSFALRNVICETGTSWQSDDTNQPKKNFCERVSVISFLASSCKDTNILKIGPAETSKVPAKPYDLLPAAKVLTEKLDFDTGSFVLPPASGEDNTSNFNHDAETSKAPAKPHAHDLLPAKKVLTEEMHFETERFVSPPVSEKDNTPNFNHDAETSKAPAKPHAHDLLPAEKVLTEEMHFETERFVSPPVSEKDNTPNFNHEGAVEVLDSDDERLLKDLRNAGFNTEEPAIVMGFSPLWDFEENVTEIVVQDLQDMNESVAGENDDGIFQSERDQVNVAAVDPVLQQPVDPNVVENVRSPSPDFDSDPGSRGESPKPRLRQPSNWKRSKTKVANATGQKHISVKGKEKKEKDVIIEACGITCKKKCNERITLPERRKVNERFWSVGDCSRQWDFLSRHVTAKPVARRTVAIEDAPTYRNYTYSYHFLVNGVKIPVCQTMFLKTLNISSMRVRLALKKLLAKDGVISPDKRGKTGNKKSLHPSVRASVINHVNLFPTYESHYTRRRSKKRYLDEKLNVRKMHRNYIAGRLPNQPHTATQRQYEDIFRREFKHKLGFYKPKKDQCGACLSWKSKPEHLKTEEARLAHEKHLENKAEARKMKDADIALGKANENVCVATFDLQKVFFCPHGENGEFIFKRKLRCYNLSFFQSVKQKGYCYVWDETIGKKGANEMSSCVKKFIETKVSEGYKIFYFFSDNCISQNKNSMLFATYNILSCKYGIEIVHSYLEKGHTQMECDSIHALIERRCDKQTICSPSKFYGVIRTAKVKQPFYDVVPMSQTDIFDFKVVAKLHDFSKVAISKVRQINIESNTSTYKQDFHGQEKTVSLLRQHVGRPVNWKTFKLPLAYNKRIRLEENQLKDLIQLCDGGHIVGEDAQFYYNLAEDQDEDYEPAADDSDHDTSDSELDYDSDDSHLGSDEEDDD